MSHMNSIDVNEELSQNFIDFSWDTNNNKAFPSVYDGLKPGARACLWEMYNKKYTSDKPHVKSAKVAGGVIASLWPHSDTAIYETFVRMAQDFIEKIPEVDFQGASGNIVLGQDSFASSRYTEVRLSKIAEDGMFRGIDKQNVPMILNFSEDEEWPKVLPAIFPRLLVNGSQGIGVGISQYWVCHNFKETADLILDYISSGELNTKEYYPDFPTGGTIINKDELYKINETGKGRIIIQGKYKIDGSQIIFTEMPYQVYIEPLITKIKELVNNEELSGIEDVINTSDKNSISLTVECAKGSNPETVLNNLFALTSLQTTIHVNQNAIVDMAPEMLTLKDVVDCYIKHNTDCIQREFEYDYKKTADRIEILEGLVIALADIDQIVELIRKSDSPKEAKEKLMNDYSLTENQSKAILDMKLSRLTKLDGVKINEELDEKRKYAAFCNKIISEESEQEKVLVERLTELRDKYGENRCSEVIQKESVSIKKNGTTKQPVVIEDVVITYNPSGYLQRIPVSEYRKSHFVSFKVTTADIILLFSNFGKFYRISAKDVKSCGMKDKGTAIGSIINLEKNERIIAAFSSDINESKPYLFFAMNNGIVKKVEKIDFIGSTRNLNGMVATKLNDNHVINIAETNGDYVILYTRNDYRIMFKADEVRAMGRNAAGVKGINLGEGDEVLDCIITSKQHHDITLQKRGGKGKKTNV